MLNLYKRYAFHDTVNLGNVRIVQTCRDEEFEGWLKAIGKDVKPHLEQFKTDTSVHNNLYVSQPLYSFFHFERQLTICQNDKVLMINHSPIFFVNSEIPGTFKKSVSSDIFIRTEFKSHFSKVSTNLSTKDSGIEIELQQDTMYNKVSLGKPSAPPISRSEPIVQINSPIKQKRGAEVDESF